MTTANTHDSERNGFPLGPYSNPHQAIYGPDSHLELMRGRRSENARQIRAIRAVAGICPTQGLTIEGSAPGNHEYPIHEKNADQRHASRRTAGCAG